MTVADEPSFTFEVLFGHIEHHCHPSRWEGAWEIPRYRVVEYNGSGTKTRDEVCETGIRIYWPDAEPAPQTLLGRIGCWMGFC